MRARLAAGFAISAEAQAEFSRGASWAARDGKPRNYSVAGDVAIIKVEGLLTERPDIWAWYMGYGNTTYPDIQQAVALAEMDPSVKRTQYEIKSPGGTVEGLFDTIATINESKKPRAVLTSFAASAAYTIAAVAGPITATNAAVEVGSVGVAQDMVVYPELVQLANTDSPKKRPDVTTTEGQAVVREELDALFELLIDAIAYGRGTTVKDVRENFGQGGLLVAGEAKKRGMLDKIQRPRLRAVGPRSESEQMPAASEPTPQNDASRAVVIDKGSKPPLATEYAARMLASTDAPAADAAAGQPDAAVVVAPEPSAEPAASGEPEQGKPMDIKELEKNHPDVYAAVFKLGVDEERDRVLGHLQAGEDSGDMQTAAASIRDGSKMTQALVAKYMGASLRKGSIAARQTTSDDVEAATAGAAVETGTKDLGDKVVDVLDSNSQVLVI